MRNITTRETLQIGDLLVKVADHELKMGDTKVGDVYEVMDIADQAMKGNFVLYRLGRKTAWWGIGSIAQYFKILNEKESKLYKLLF